MTGMREGTERDAPTAATTQTFPIIGAYTCANCNGTIYPGLTHHCPALRRLSPMGGGPNPWGTKPK